MANPLMRYKDSAGVWHDIPFRPTAAVLSVNGKNGIVDLVETDIPDLTTHIDSKLVKPATAGTENQVLANDGAGGTKWVTLGDAGVLSVNGKTGIVVLNAGDLAMLDGTNLNTTVNSKLTTPTGGNLGDMLVKTSTGAEWRTPTDAPVKSVNGRTGDVVLKAMHINMNSGENVENEIVGKITRPTGGISGQVLGINTSGVIAWLDNTGKVTSVNSKVGDVVLNSTDIKMVNNKTLEVEINSKLDTPTSGTKSAGKTIAVKADNTLEWRDDVASVNSKTGDVVLSASDIKTAAAKTIEQELANRIEFSASAVNGAVPTKTGSTYTWQALPVTSVNSKTGGDIVLTANDIKLQSQPMYTVETLLTTCIVKIKNNGTELPIVDRTVNIPAATDTSFGVISSNSAKGTTIDSDGKMGLSTSALEYINGARKEVTAEEYDMEKMYQVGQYVQHKGRYYVCKTSNSTGVFTLANFSETSVSAERNNMLEQLIAALGIKENPRRWDSTHNKILYDFVMDN